MRTKIAIAALLAALMPAPALAATTAPLARMGYLVGAWKCTYNAGSVHLPYDTTYAYDRDGHILRQIASFAGGSGDEELLSYDAQHNVWTAIVLDDQGDATVMHAISRDPNHIAYRSVYPDANVDVRFDRLSASQYTLRGTVRSGGKTTTSIDTCLRAR